MKHQFKYPLNFLISFAIFTILSPSLLAADGFADADVDWETRSLNEHEYSHFGNRLGHTIERHYDISLKDVIRRCPPPKVSADGSSVLTYNRSKWKGDKWWISSIIYSGMIRKRLLITRFTSNPNWFGKEATYDVENPSLEVGSYHIVKCVARGKGYTINPSDVFQIIRIRSYPPQNWYHGRDLSWYINTTYIEHSE